MRLVRIREAKPLGNYRVQLTLTDGRIVERDLGPMLVGPVFAEQHNRSKVRSGNPVEFRALALRRGADALREKFFNCNCGGCRHIVIVAPSVKVSGRRQYGIMALWRPER